jgi:WD40 repeat protein
MARYAPHGQFLAAAGTFGGPVVRTSTGELVGRVRESWKPDSLSLDWTTAVSSSTWGSPLSVSLFGMDPLVTLDASSAPNATHVELHATGVMLQPGRPFAELGVIIGCWYDVQGATAPIARLYALRDAVYQLPYSTEVATLDPTVCDLNAWSYGLDLSRSMRAVPNELAVVFGSDATGTVYHFDLQTGALTQRTLHFGEPSDQFAFGATNPPGFTAAAVSPDGRLVAFSHADGGLRVLSLPDLQDAAPAISAGVGLANSVTYTPSVESPLAWSPDGSLLLYLDVSGEVAARNTQDWTHVRAFGLSEGLLRADGRAREPGVPVPLAMAFTSSGSHLAVVYDQGVAQWRCGAEEEYAPPTAGEYLLQPPDDSVKTQEASRWTLWRVDDHWQPAHLVSWSIDGKLQAEPALGGWNSTLWFDTPGAHLVEAQVDDGFSVISTQAWVNVEP